MAEAFERHLTALFAEVPEAPDAEAFVAAFEARLDAEIRRRRLILGAFALAGFMAAVAVVTLSGGLGLGGAFEGLASPNLDWAAKVGPWLLVGLAVSALTFVATPSERRI